MTNLEITIGGVETSGSKDIFRKNTRLQKLGIIVRKSRDGTDMSCTSVDRLLIGGPNWI